MAFGTTPEARFRISADDKTKAAFNSVKGRMKDVSGVALKLQAILGGLIIARIGAGIIRTAADFETLRKTLQTVTGSAEEAEKAFGGLREFARTTPFQLSEVVDAFIKLKALGLDPSSQALQAYGNVASAMGKSLNQFIEAVADAATGEFERLKEFGIKAKSQGDQVTFTFQGVATTVRKSADEINGYLQGIGENQFAGAMANQSDTLNVSISNLKDAFANLSDQIATDTGFLAAIKKGSEAVIQMTVDVAGLLRQMGILEATSSIQAFQDQIDILNRKLEGSKARRGSFVSSILGTREELDAEIKQYTSDIAILQAAIENMRRGATDPLASTEGGGGVDQGPSDAETKAADKAAKELEKLRESMAAKLEVIRVGLLNEQDAETDAFLNKLFIIEESRELELISLTTFQTIKEKLEAAHQEKLRKIEEKGWTARQKFENKSMQDKAKTIFGELNNITQGVASHNKALFRINQVASIAEAIINANTGASRTLATYPWPLAGVLAGLHYAAGAARVAAIASTSYGGGSSGASGGTSSGATPVFQADPVFGLPTDQATSNRTDVTINIGDAQFLSAEGVRQLIEQINEQIDDGVNIGSVRVA